MNSFLTGAAIIISLNSFVCLCRAIKGPTIQDRVLVINIVGSKALIILVLIAFIFKRSFFLDAAILLVLLNFIVIVVVSRYLEVSGREVNQTDR